MMMRNLTLLLSILFILQSCAHKTTLVPMANDVTYADGYLVATTSNNDLQLDINFERASKEYLFFYIVASNIGDKQVTVDPSNFYYTLNNQTVKYQAMPLDMALNDIDKYIDKRKKSREITSWLEVFDAVTELGITASDTDNTPEENLERDLSYESRSDLYAESQLSDADKIIDLYETKEYLNKYMMLPATLETGASHLGLIIFPKAKNKFRNGLRVLYWTGDSYIEVSFGGK